MTPKPAPRRAVTLIELLVVMSILTGLLALALMLVPNVNQQNAVANGVNEISATFKTAQGLAAATRLPHGVRFLTNGGYTAGTLQYLEMPPVIVSDLQALAAVNGDTTGANTSLGPRVQFTYTLAGTGASPNAVASRQCQILSVPLEQAGEIVSGATVVLPELGFWSLITGSTQGASYSSARTGLAVADLTVTLQVYPDAALGTATSYQTFLFGVYSVPVPVLGEPTVQLPAGIAADLQISFPALQTAGQNYDVMFSPFGPTVASGNVAANTNVYVWVRDVTKLTNPGGANPNSLYAGDFGANYGNFVNAFRLGGDQQVVGVRAGGFVGTAPVVPAVPSGGFAAYAPAVPLAPFVLAQQKLDR
jgi:prepilin-type N-terminal cleavage/methylation domain-containing protein